MVEPKKLSKEEIAHQRRIEEIRQREREALQPKEHVPARDPEIVELEATFYEVTNSLAARLYALEQRQVLQSGQGNRARKEPVTWRYPSNLADVETLHETGCWPDEKVPTWAQERADYYHTSPASVLVERIAYEDEIERLRERSGYLEQGFQVIAGKRFADTVTSLFAKEVLSGVADLEKWEKWEGKHV